MAYLNPKFLAPVAASAVIGVAGLGLIQVSEGKVNTYYKDAVGVGTICYGHTGRFAYPGARWSDDECTAILIEDIRVHGNGMDKCIKVHVNRNQRDALLSWTINFGVARFCGSTMARKLNAGDYRGASAEFPKWNLAGGRVLKGLVVRRDCEQRLFNHPDVSPYRGPASGLPGASPELRKCLKG